MLLKWSKLLFTHHRNVRLVQVSQDTVQAVAGEVADRVHERLGLFSPTPPPGPNPVTPAPTTTAGASPPFIGGSCTTHRRSCLLHFSWALVTCRAWWLNAGGNTSTSRCEVNCVNVECVVTMQLPHR